MLREEGPIEALSRSTKRELSSYETQLQLMELYEVLYGICNHNAPEMKMRPLALMAVHAKEDSRSYSPLYKRIDQFRRLRLFETFGVPLDRFLALPADIVQLLIRLGEIATHEEGKKSDEIMRELTQGDGRSK